MSAGMTGCSQPVNTLREGPITIEDSCLASSISRVEELVENLRQVIIPIMDTQEISETDKDSVEPCMSEIAFSFYQKNSRMLVLERELNNMLQRIQL